MDIVTIAAALLGGYWVGKQVSEFRALQYCNNVLERTDAIVLRMKLLLFRTNGSALRRQQCPQCKVNMIDCAAPFLAPGSHN